MIEAEGMVVRGYRVASGLAADARFPEGTIAPQLPMFLQRVPGFEAYLGGAAFPGTVNVRIPGARIAILAPEIMLEGVRWTDSFPPERFFLSRAELVREGVVTPAFLYIPDPATKPDHHQSRDIVELLAPRIGGLAYGDPVTLRFGAHAIAV